MGSTPANRKPVSTATYLLTAIAWLAATGLGLTAIYYLFQLVVGIYVRAGGTEKGVAGVLQYGSVFFGAIFWLAAVVITGEYALKHLGERGTWKRFAWTIGVELIIILLGAFVV